jgi:hypothetical protein
MTIDKKKQGRLNKARGARFELKVREDLESEGWVLDKWTNNVDLIQRKLVKAKRKYNPFIGSLSIGTGFPDFVGFKFDGKKYDIIGIEVKLNGSLDKSEKDKCAWYIKNNIFSKILIAKLEKVRKRVCIEYIDFEEKYGKKFI